jgi:hypothetical protein
MWASVLRHQRFLIIACAIPLNIAAADRPLVLERYVASSWTHKDGLPSTLIHAITQSRDGYLWLGTSDGLVRFDGISFTHQRLFSSPNHLLGAVSALCGTRDGALWMGSASGYVTRMVGPVLQKYRLGAEIDAIVETPKDGVWVIASNGFYRFDESPREGLSPAERITEDELARLVGSHRDGISLESKRLVQARENFASYARKIRLAGHIFFLNQEKDGRISIAENSFVHDRGVAVARPP